MLGSCNLVAFTATTDGARSRGFYEGVLGLAVVSDDPFALVLDGNGTALRVTKLRQFRPHSHTVLGAVADIEARSTLSRQQASPSSAIPGWNRTRGASGPPPPVRELPGSSTPTETCCHSRAASLPQGIASWEHSFRCAPACHRKSPIA